MRIRLLWSLGACALCAAAPAAQNAPPANLLQSSGPAHDPALAKPDPAEKVNHFPGLENPQRFADDLRQSGAAHDPTLLGLGQNNVLHVSAAEARSFAGSLRSSGAAHDPALAKPDPAQKVNHFPGLEGLLKLGSDLRRAGPAHDPALLKPLPEEKVNQLGR